MITMNYGNMSGMLVVVRSWILSPVWRGVVWLGVGGGNMFFFHSSV